MSVLLDRAKGRNIVMYSTEGGMDIEVAEKTPHFQRRNRSKSRLTRFQARKIAFNLGLSGAAHKEMVKFVAAFTKHTILQTLLCLRSIRY
jgi:succinyl-CoA synthetase beta subunit